MDIVSIISNLPSVAQLAAVLVVVLVIATLCKRLKQPLIIGYLIAGVLIGTVNLVHHESSAQETFFQLFSQLGISLLLFSVGLGLNPRTIQEHGKTALFVGVMQVLVCVIIGFALNWFLGFSRQASLLIAIGLSFSSTIVIIKLLHDAQEHDTVYGKITTGVLIVQDIIAMILLMAIAFLGSKQGGGGGVMLVEGLGLIVVVIAVAKWVMPRVLPRVVDAHELTLLIGIGRCLLLGSAFQHVGFSYEIGCLLAGMSFAVSPWRRAMMEKLQPLRDFFIIIFFVHLGIQLNIGEALKYRYAIVLLTLFVLIVKPLITYWALKRFGYATKSSFKASLSLGQMSEFSLILMNLGLTYGFVTHTSRVSLMMLVGLLSILINSLFFTHREKLFSLWKRLISDDLAEESTVTVPLSNAPIILIGYGKFGRRLAKILTVQGIQPLILESHPVSYQAAVQDGYESLFADATSEGILRELCTENVQMIVSTMREFDDDRVVAQQVKKLRADIVMVALTLHEDQALELYDAGCDYVLLPYHISADHIGAMIHDMEFDVKKILSQKTIHRESLNK